MLSILVIDDDLVFLSTLKKALNKAGYHVEVTTNGFDGLKKHTDSFFYQIFRGVFNDQVVCLLD